MAPRQKVEDEPHKVQELLRRSQVAQKQQQQREQNGNANGSANGVANGDGKDGQEEGMSERDGLVSNEQDRSVVSSAQDEQQGDVVGSAQEEEKSLLAN